MNYKQQGIMFGPNWEDTWKKFLRYKKVIPNQGRMESNPETIDRLLNEVTYLRKKVKEMEG